MSDDSTRRLLQHWVAQAEMDDIVWLMVVIAQRCGGRFASFIERFRAGKTSAVLTVAVDRQGGGSGKKESSIDEWEAEIRKRDDEPPTTTSGRSLGPAAPDTQSVYM